MAGKIQSRDGRGFRKAHSSTGYRVSIASFLGELGITLILLMLFLVSSSSLAKSYPNKKYTHGGWERANILDYPSLSKSLNKGAKGIDPFMNRQWGLNIIGFFSRFTPFAAPRGIKPCNKKIVVAIIDTGIDYTHVDLNHTLWKNEKEMGPWTPPKNYPHACRDKGCNGIDDDLNGMVDDTIGWDFVHNTPLPYDAHGHGTHIAGIVAAKGGNKVAIAGICSGISIMSLKYYDNSVLGYNNLRNTVLAINYAIKNGAHIINYSGGGSDPAPIEAFAVKRAKEAGILFIAAAGNDGRNNDFIPYYPASYPNDNVLSVAAMNHSRKLLSSSNYGKKSVDLVAPGLGIYSTLPKNRVGTMSGTSQATAFVTGVAALLASQRPEKKFDYKYIKSLLMESSKNIMGGRTKMYLKGGTLELDGALKLQSTQK